MKNAKSVLFRYTYSIVALILVICTFIGCAPENKNQTGMVDDSFVSDCRKGYENVNGNTHANLYNDGIAAEQDGWIYFYVQPQNGNSRSGQICKHKSDSNEIITIATFDKVAERLSVKGDYIYYLYSGNDLHKMRTDGSDIQDVFTNDEHDESNYMIIGDYIYLTKESKYSSTYSSTSVVRYNINNMNDYETIYSLNENDKFCGVTGNYVVVKENRQNYDEETLRIYNMETGETFEHSCAIGTYFAGIQLTENAVYYTNDYCNSLAKLNLNDMSVITAKNDGLSASAINFIDENTIYLTLGNWQTAIFGSANLLVNLSFDLVNRGQYYEIVEESATKICVVGDWIYYTSGSPGLENYCRIKTDGTGWEMLYEFK